MIHWLPLGVNKCKASRHIMEAVKERDYAEQEKNVLPPSSNLNSVHV